MLLADWLKFVPEKTTVTSVTVGVFDGVHAGRVTARRANPIPNTMNEWTWMIPLDANGHMSPPDNPLVFVWGQEWWDWCESLQS